MNIDITIERDEYDDAVNIIQVFSERAAIFLNEKYHPSDRIRVGSTVRTKIPLIPLLEDFDGFKIGLRNDRGELDTITPPLH